MGPDAVISHIIIQREDRAENIPVGIEPEVRGPHARRIGGDDGIRMAGVEAAEVVHGLEATIEYRVMSAPVMVKAWSS